MHSKHHKQTIEEWYAQNFIPNAPLCTPAFLCSQAVTEDPETVTDRGYFAVALSSEASKDGKICVAVYRETITYTRGQTGEPDKVKRIQTEVLATVRRYCQVFFANSDRKKPRLSLQCPSESKRQ